MSGWQVLHNEERHFAIYDEIIDHAAIRPLMIPRIAMRIECDEIDLLLLLKLMQRDGCILAGDEMCPNVNVFQVGARLQILEILLRFFAVSVNNEVTRRGLRQRLTEPSEIHFIPSLSGG